MGNEVQEGLETTCSGEMLRIVLGLGVGPLPGMVLAAPRTSCWSGGSDWNSPAGNTDFEMWFSAPVWSMGRRSCFHSSPLPILSPLQSLL